MARIDAMPDVPSWKQIEAEVDAALKAELDAEIANLQAAGRSHLIDRARMIPHAASNRWEGHLHRLYPQVYRIVRGTSGGSRMISNGARVWFIRTYVPGGVAARERDISEEWFQLHIGNTAYALQRLSLPEVQALLAAFNKRGAEGGFDFYDNSIDARFRADLEAYIDRKMMRTYLAQSRLIDHLAMRDRDAAQHLAHWVAPATITPRRPLAVHAPAGAPDMTHQQYLASISAVMHAPGQDPAATLARARAMLDTLMQSIEQQP